MISMFEEKNTSLSSNSNGVIIGTFVKYAKILQFIDFLKNKTNVNIKKVFVFEVEGNANEYLVTFSSPRNHSYFELLHDSTVLHTKNGCLFSINALNKYIELHNQNSIPNKQYQVDWGALKNTLLITTNGYLKHTNIKKINIENLNNI